MARKNIMLCYPFEEKRFNRWGNKGIMQPKLNGQRCRIIISPEGHVSMRSSEDNEIVSVPHIAKDVIKLGIRNVELDGELYVHGMPLQEIESIVRRTVNLHPAHELMEFHIFDIVSNKNQTERLGDVLRLPTSNNIKLVQPVIVSNMRELDIFYKDYVENGYEGFILRHPTGLYKRKRSTEIMKCKPNAYDEYPIIGYMEEHSLDGTPKGTLGALVLETDGISFNVGTGFTRKQRELLWEIKETLPGKTCKVKYQALTMDNIPVPGVFMEVIDERERRSD